MKSINYNPTVEGIEEAVAILRKEKWDIIKEQFNVSTDWDRLEPVREVGRRLGNFWRDNLDDNIDSEVIKFLEERIGKFFPEKNK